MPKTEVDFGLPTLSSYIYRLKLDLGSVWLSFCRGLRIGGLMHYEASRSASKTQMHQPHRIAEEAVGVQSSHSLP
jgi:hypothetical protein